MPMPVSDTVKCRTGVAGTRSVQSNLDYNLTLGGELDGIADKVDENLPQPRFVSTHQFRHIRVNERN